MDIFTGNLISISYFQGNLEEPYFCELIARKKAHSLNKLNEVPARIYLRGTLFITVFPGEPRGTLLSHNSLRKEQDSCNKIGSLRFPRK
jgi:hypothetical protein